MPTPTEKESRQDYINRCIPVRQRESRLEGGKESVGKSAVVCAAMFDEWKEKQGRATK